MSTISETLKLQNEVNWQAATEHEFCRDLANGSLPSATMANYLIQDYSFIDGFVRLAACAIANAPSLADSAPLSQFLALITSTENTYFLRSFEALNVSDSQWQSAELWSETKDFQALMREAAASGSYVSMIAVLVVAEWTYLSWATPYYPPEEDLPFYFAEWITLHAGEGFEAVVSYLRSQLDIAWEDANKMEQQTAANLFAEAVRLERAFFDRSYASHS